MISTQTRLAVTALLALASPAAAQSPPLAPRAEPTDAVLELRRRFMDASVAALTFHSIEQIFDTAPVAHDRRVRRLPERKQALDFRYTYGGRSFAAEDVLERTHTNALLILKDGQIVYERYRNYTRPDTRFLSMSMAKSITSLLVGAAVDEGRIRSIDDQIVTYVSELRGTAYDGVTIRQAIDMRTGVDRADADQFKPGSTGAQMREQILIRNQRAAADEALVVKRKEAPGGRFDYSTLNTTVVGWVLENATGQPLADYTASRLWSRIGTQADGSWIMDGATPRARPFNGMGFNATLRDYGRLGQFMLDGGRVAGRQLISREWLEQSVGGRHVATAPGSTRGYQHFWWTVPDSPAYMAIGLQGQYIYVDPATRTVIVKLSYAPLGDRASGEESEAFFAAASRWKN